MEKRLSKKARSAYRNLSEEIFLRAKIVKNLSKDKKTYDILKLEVAALHIRKICESYAFLGILGNEREVVNGCKSLQRTHQITKILNKRPDFIGDILPQPVHFQSPENGNKTISRRVEKPITKELLLNVHGRVSFLLHQFNPFRTSLDIDGLPDLLAFPDQIVDTLAAHELVNEYSVVWGFSGDNGKFQLAFGEIINSVNEHQSSN